MQPLTGFNPAREVHRTQLSSSLSGIWDSSDMLSQFHKPVQPLQHRSLNYDRCGVLRNGPLRPNWSTGFLNVRALFSALVARDERREGRSNE